MHELLHEQEEVVQRELPGVNWRQIVSLLLVALVTAGLSSAITISAVNARHDAAITNLQEIQHAQQAKLDTMRPASEMVSKDEFQQFLKRFDDMNANIQTLTIELQRTREAVAAYRGRTGH